MMQQYSTDKLPPAPAFHQMIMAALTPEERCYPDLVQLGVRPPEALQGGLPLGVDRAQLPPDVHQVSDDLTVLVQDSIPALPLHVGTTLQVGVLLGVQLSDWGQISTRLTL